MQNHLLEVEARRAAGPTWDTVRYMIAQIQYGGRITDDFDNLLMRTYAAKFFHQGVLAANYTLYRAEKGPVCYQVPIATEIEMYRKVCAFPRPPLHVVHTLSQAYWVVAAMRNERCNTGRTIAWRLLKIAVMGYYLGSMQDVLEHKLSSSAVNLLRWSMSDS